MGWAEWVASTPSDPGSFLDYLRTGGVLGMLAMIVIGTLRKWWLPAWYVHDLEKERDEWKAMALSGTRLAERSSSVLEDAIKRGQR